MSSATAQTPQLAADGLDLVCRPGIYPGYETIQFQYNVPAKLFFAKMESFNKGWYTHIIGTSGIDNTPGARRTVKYTEEDGSSQPILLEEELVYYRHTKNKLEMYWKGVSGPITFPYKPHDANFESYVEGFTVTSIASGTATLITHFVNYTTKTPVPAYHFAASDQTQATAALAKKLGAQLFAGAFPFNGCPVRLTESGHCG